MHGSNCIQESEEKMNYSLHSRAFQLSAFDGLTMHRLTTTLANEARLDGSNASEETMRAQAINCTSRRGLFRRVLRLQLFVINS